MGAKIGKRVYWPGSGIYCLDPELLEVGDDVVFGSRSQLITTDSLGTEKIIIGDGGKVFFGFCIFAPELNISFFGQPWLLIESFFYLELA